MEGGGGGGGGAGVLGQVGLLGGGDGVGLEVPAAYCVGWERGEG